jgi:hypothetical protein
MNLQEMWDSRIEKNARKHNREIEQYRKKISDWERGKPARNKKEELYSQKLAEMERKMLLRNKYEIEAHHTGIPSSYPGISFFDIAMMGLIILIILKLNGAI